MNETIQLMMNLIKSEIFEIPVKLEREILESELNLLYDVSKKHDVTPIVASQLGKISALKPEYEVSKKFKNELFTAVFRYERSNYDLTLLSDLFEKSGIDYMVLKGGVVREYYSLPYLRTSCDIDILIRQEDIEKATDLITNQLKFELQKKEEYDLSFFSPSGGHFELHFNLVERDFDRAKILCDIWNSGELIKEADHKFKMSGELFLLYHIYHSAKHFIHGGCGIKPVIDLMIIKNKFGIDEDKAVSLLKESGLEKFYQGISALAQVWFNDKQHSDSTLNMQNFILQGGVYGTLEQNLAMSQNRRGGKVGHLLSKIFLSYSTMKVYYPSVKKCPILFPFYQVRRWFRIIFCGGRKRAMLEMKLNQNLSETKKERAKNLMDELGL